MPKKMNSTASAPVVIVEDYVRAIARLARGEFVTPLPKVAPKWAMELAGGDDS